MRDKEKVPVENEKWATLIEEAHRLALSLTENRLPTAAEFTDTPLVSIK